MANQRKNNNKMNMNMSRPSMLWLYGLIGAFIIGYYVFGDVNDTPVPSDWATVERMVEKGEVEKIQVVNRDQAQVFLKKEAVEQYRRDTVDKRFRRLPETGVQLLFTIGSVDSFREDLKAAEQQSGQVVPVVYENKANDWTNVLINLLPWVLIIGVWIFVMRSMSRGAGGGAGGGIMNVGKAKAQVFDKDNSKRVTFKDVAGLEEAKVEIMEIVDFLKKSDKYKELGAKIPKGALLVGPPGTGKTLLAKAVAGEANVPFLSISGSDFVEMFVGVGASRVRDLFAEAKKTAPSIVFIDEIDAVGRHRGAGLGGGHDEREQTLNQLLVEMDGFGANSGVIIIAATNRKDILDPALLRPGRFDRQILVGYPDVKGREEILKVHVRNKPMGPDVNLKTVAKATVGFTGADLENVVNEAALLAARANKRAITMKEIEDATIKVIAGPEKRSKVVTEKEKRLTAYHEAGHAVCTYYCPTQDPVHEISIIPRGMAGGYTMSLPEDDRGYLAKTAMQENIVTLLGGRMAELIVLDDISTGASNDLERATQIARSMVTRYGFSEKLGPVVYGQDQGEVFLGMDINRSRNYSEEVAAEIDQEIRRIIEEAYSRAREILEAHRDQLEVVAQYLMEHEKIGEFGFKALMEGREVNPEEDQHGIFSKVISDAQKEAAAQLEAAQTESQPKTPASEPEAPAAAPEAGTPEESSAPDQKEE